MVDFLTHICDGKREAQFQVELNNADKMPLHLLNFNLNGGQRLGLPEQLAFSDWWWDSRHGGETLPEQEKRDGGEDAPLAGGQEREKTGQDNEESE